METKTAVIFDGDGDGISATAIWLMNKPREYFSVTNKQKNERRLVKKIISYLHISEIQNLGIFDLDAEQNLDALKNIPKYLNVDFIDHHTKNSSIIPQHINNFTQPDTRENCTATISYELAKRKGILNNSLNLIKATQLGIIGLANDGKGKASQNFGEELISSEDRNSLIRYAKAINFGSATGKMNSTEILKGFVNSNTPLSYLVSTEKPNELIEDRKDAIKSLENNSLTQEKEGIILYQLPSKTEEDKELSLMGYNEFMNSRMEEQPDKMHIGLIETPEGKYIFSARNQKGLAYDLINTIAEIYEKTALGRETAAGFSVDTRINRKNLLEKILGNRK